MTDQLQKLHVYSKWLIANMYQQFYMNCEIKAHIICIFSSVQSFPCFGFRHFSSCSVLLCLPKNTCVFVKYFNLLVLYVAVHFSS